jgi:hypothetical protein
MTLIIAGKRENFAVLASDGLWSDDPNDEAKIVCHPSPSIPIACTFSGLAALPVDDAFKRKHSIPADKSARTTTFIRDVLEDITSIDDLTTENIGELLAGRLVPFVNENLYIACHVAMVKNEKSDVGFMMVGMRAQWPPNPVDHGAWGWWPNGVEQGCVPCVVADLVRDRLAHADTSPARTLDEVAAIMRKTVSEAIAEEAKHTTGNRSIGGTAHVAKVTRDGAFII